jgi:hypothetical protein
MKTMELEKERAEVKMELEKEKADEKMEQMKAELASKLQKEKYEYELEIEGIRQASNIERNAMDNLPTKEMGMKMIDQPEQ